MYVLPLLCALLTLRLISQCHLMYFMSCPAVTAQSFVLPSAWIDGSRVFWERNKHLLGLSPREESGLHVVVFACCLAYLSFLRQQVEEALSREPGECQDCRGWYVFLSELSLPAMSWEKQRVRCWPAIRKASRELKVVL